MLTSVGETSPPTPLLKARGVLVALLRRQNLVAFGEILKQCPCSIVIKQSHIDILAQIAHLRGGYAKQIDDFSWLEI